MMSISWTYSDVSYISDLMRLSSGQMDPMNMYFMIRNLEVSYYGSNNMAYMSINHDTTCFNIINQDLSQVNWIDVGSNTYSVAFWNWFTMQGWDETIHSFTSVIPINLPNCERFAPPWLDDLGSDHAGILYGLMNVQTSEWNPVVSTALASTIMSDFYGIDLSAMVNNVTASEFMQHLTKDGTGELCHYNINLPNAKECGQMRWTGSYATGEIHLGKDFEAFKYVGTADGDNKASYVFVTQSVSLYIEANSVPQFIGMQLDYRDVVAIDLYVPSSLYAAYSTAIANDSSVWKSPNLYSYDFTNNTVIS